MSGAGCSQDCNTCSITLRACSLSPGAFLLHVHAHAHEGKRFHETEKYTFITSIGIKSASTSPPYSTVAN